MPRSRRPNIVFLLSDQHRPDALGCFPNPAIETPNLDRMAAEGTRFSRAYCQSPVCQPSRASLLHGRYVADHGILWNGMEFDPDLSTVPRALQEAGYATAVVGKTHFYSRPPARSRDLRENVPHVASFGFDHVLEEFDKYIHLRGAVTPYTEHLREKGLLETYLEETRGAEMRSPNHWKGFASRLPQEDHQTAFTADRALEWLEGHEGDDPFLLCVSFVAPHPPFIDDPAWAEHYRDVDVPVGPATRPSIPEDAWGGYLDRMREWGFLQSYDEDFVRNTTRHYYGLVSLIDQRVGDIVRGIEQRGWADDTWFVYASDHGEMLGDHGMWGKAVFYRSSVGVPLIIRPPGGGSARTVDSPVELTDVTRTLLEIAGASPPEGTAGRSLLPVLDGSAERVRDGAVSEIGGFFGRDHYFVTAATDRYRLTYDRDNDLVCELYDLAEDPDELHNLASDPAHAGIVDDLRSAYVEPLLSRPRPEPAPLPRREGS